MNRFKKEADETCFIGAQDCCVCYVDIVNFTRITATQLCLTGHLNTMAAIGRNFGAKIIKNVGDCLILCYPRTSDASNKSAFNDVLECCIIMIESRNTINQRLYEGGLPAVSYRISADYGRVELARFATFFMLSSSAFSISLLIFFISSRFNLTPGKKNP